MSARWWLAVLALLASCTGGPGSSASSVASGSLTVYAAASLQDAFESIATAYEAEAGVAIALSFDASSALRTQISEGAPADLFASADTTNPQQLVDAGLTDGNPTVFATNALAIVAPAGDSDGVRTWAELAAPGTRIVAAGEDVPISGYAAELVASLADLADAPDGFAAAYDDNVVSREDNVRAVLAKIEAGEGDAAIVYATDATSSQDVVTVPFPDDVNVTPEYAFVTLADASDGTAAFGSWLLGSDAQAILEEFGFRPPPG